MISSKSDYLYYLECDRVALKKKDKKPKWHTYILGGEEEWRLQRILRKLEYYKNTKKNAVLTRLLTYRYNALCVKYGVGIPINVFGPGLSIAHARAITCNVNSKVGENCRIQTCVTLGATNGTADAPVLGDNIFLGDGCKIIGGVTVASNVQIGANAVVVKSISEEGTTWGGVPAKKISDNSSESNLVKATEIVDKSKFYK